MGEEPYRVRFPLCWYVDQAEIRTGKGEVALEAAAGIISQENYSVCCIPFSKYILFIPTCVLLLRMFPLLEMSSPFSLPIQNPTYL